MTKELEISNSFCLTDYKLRPECDRKRTWRGRNNTLYHRILNEKLGKQAILRSAKSSYDKLVLYKWDPKESLFLYRTVSPSDSYSDYFSDFNRS